jgi:hypothetical protein
LAVQQITEYIRQHSGTYTRNAIDTQLLSAGYAQADITAAWASLDAETQGYPEASPETARVEIPGAPPSSWGDDAVAPVQKPRRVVNSGVFWLTLLGFIVLSYGLPAALAISPPRDQSGIPNFTPAWVSFLALQIGALVGGIVALVMKARPLAMGLLIGLLMVVVVVPVTVLLIGLGLCLALMSGTGF